MNCRRFFLMPALLLASQAFGTIIPAPTNAGAVTITVTVASNDSAEFLLISGVVDTIDLKVLGKKYRLSFQGCTPIRGVRYETVTLIFDSTGDARAQGYFTLTFSFGPDETPVDELSRALISFYNGKPIAISEQKSGKSLCPGR